MNEELQPDLTELTQVDPVAAGSPESIGNYRILQKLGEGGMGVVYEAEQTRPVRRTVALKVIKLGMDTAQVVVRFESERQALALMNHPTIARVYDAGATAEGRPFFAMECVRGVPITEYCRRHRLSTHDRLELFMQVCSGVEHAHQKGVIHRDLKPSNVLVREQDGQHVPKIIDFGIAKATAHRLTDKTLFTEMGQLIGTPEYMSPEQAEMSGMDIDTRTDVYLLGVMLYELLCGELPFPSSDLRAVGFQEYRRRVIEDEPPRPSARIAVAGEAARVHAKALGLEPRGLARTLRGDLDWIVMKALAKERTRRYSSASELSSDLRRYLGHEPVLAGPPSNLYRMRKFARRHKAGVAFAAVLLVLLTGFAAAMAMQAKRVEIEADKAKREADTLRVVSGFLEKLLKGSDPAESRGEEVTARELLDQAASQIDTELKDSPEVRARLMSIIGDVYASNGLKDQALALLEHALRIQREERHGEDPEMAVTMTRLGALLSTEFSRTDEGLKLYRDGLELQIARLGPDDPHVARTKNSLATLLLTRGETKEALELFEQALSVLTKTENDVVLAPLLTNQGVLLRKAGRFAEAQPLLERALAIRLRSFGSDKPHPQVARTRMHLARLFESKGNYGRARELLAQVLADWERLNGPISHRVGETLHMLAVLSLREGRRQEAVDLRARALDIFSTIGSLDNQFVLYDEARYLALTGDVAAALRYLDQAVVQHHFKSAGDLQTDPDLEALRDTVEYKTILAHVDGRGQAGS